MNEQAQVTEDASVPSETLPQDVSVEQQMPEPLFNQRQMSDVARRERERGYEKGRREALMEYQEQQKAQAQQSNQANMSGQSDVDALRQFIAQEASKHIEGVVQQTNYNQAVNSFRSKYNAMKEEFPELGKKLGFLDDPKRNPAMTAITLIANNTANPVEVVNEIVTDPIKRGALVGLANNPSPDALQELDEEIRRISASIEANQKASKAAQSVEPPLDRLNPSQKGKLMNNDPGNRSVSDFRRDPKYRGW